MASDQSPSTPPRRHAGPEWHVAQCACGRLLLRIGAVRLELSRQEFADLHRLLACAMTEFDIATSAHPIVHVTETTH